MEVYARQYDKQAEHQVNYFLRTSAFAGQGLLETNSYLEETLQMAYQEFEKKLEEMEQAKHSLELKLDVRIFCV